MADMERVAWVLATLLGYAVLCLWSFRHVLFARRREPVGAAGDDFVLVAYASQGGTAAELARDSAALLEPHVAVRVMALNQVNDQVLSGARRALFIASTYGEGEPPDNGIAFQRRYLSSAGALDLSHLQFAVLALGDRTYRQFCEFGRQLQTGLEGLGASPLWGLTEAASDELSAVDGKIADWCRRLRTFLLGMHSEVEPVSVPVPVPGCEFAPWRLASRHHLNPGSPGGPAFYLSLEPSTEMPLWEAGDIAVIQPRNSAALCDAALARLARDGAEQVTCRGVARPLREWLAESRLPALDALAPVPSLPEWLAALPALPTREYSIASVPEEGAIHLLVRQQTDAEGCLGAGSGWLTSHAAIGDTMALRVRNNPGFRVPESDCPLILIGSGTGLAGLRAHLSARELAGATGRNWLLFGERTRAYDNLLAEDLERWHASGLLERLDQVFSRDGDPCRYVQDLLPQVADELRRWLAEGAVICVCGSLTGVGAGVEQALVVCLGGEQLDELKISGRYRRDLY